MPKGPRKLGLEDGKFSPCPKNRICVSTMDPESDKIHYIEPIKYTTSLKEAKQKIIDTINSFKRTEIITELGDYIHSTFTTAIFHWTDDVEFYIDDNGKVIHFKSQTRINGYTDWGKNRSRMKKFKKRFNKLK